MNDTTQKIAEEAARQLWADDWSDEDAPAFHQCAIKHFKSAIEKAYCAGVDAMTQAGIESVNESRSAHASEQ